MRGARHRHHDDHLPRAGAGARTRHRRRPEQHAPFHQHFITTRMDLDIDGTDNTVYAKESVPEPMGPDNPYGLSFAR